ncbi:hypothetical protein BDZ89DRAFT_1050318, partial [Hymenopellis radicata]
MPLCLNLRSSLGALNRCRDVGIRLFDGSLRLLWNCLVTLADLHMFDYLALSSARCCNDDGPRSRPSSTFLQDFSPFVDSRPEPWICLDPGLLGSLTDLDFDYGRTFNPWSLRLSIRGRYRRDAANIMKRTFEMLTNYSQSSTVNYTFGLRRLQPTFHRGPRAVDSYPLSGRRCHASTLLRYMRNSANIEVHPWSSSSSRCSPTARSHRPSNLKSGLRLERKKADTIRSFLSVWLRAARSLSDKLLISSEGDLKESIGGASTSNFDLTRRVSDAFRELSVWTM